MKTKNKLRANAFPFVLAFFLTSILSFAQQEVNDWIKKCNNDPNCSYGGSRTTIACEDMEATSTRIDSFYCPAPNSGILRYVRVIHKFYEKNPSGSCSVEQWTFTFTKNMCPVPSENKDGENLSEEYGKKDSENSDVENVVSYIFPNPANDQIKLNFYLENESNTVNASFFDLSGRLIHIFYLNDLSKGFNSKSIDISNLSNGMYFYELNIGDKRANGKIAIKRD